MGMREIRLPTVSDELLGFMIDRCPEASFVAEGKGGIMAFSLACRWGTTAWLGPIAVLPPAQGQGIGRQLVNASRAVLDDLGVATVGIETMPRSYRNLQFYSRLGMAFECMTLDMSLTKTGLEAWSAETEGTELSIEALEPAPEQDRTRILDQVAVLSGRVAPGLDYRPEAVQTLNHRLGDAFVARIADVPVGFAVAHTVPYAREEMPGTARINTLVVAPPPEGLSSHEYNVVLSGPALCRVFGRVNPGDLLQVSEQAGYLEPTSLWTRWFVRERIFARAIDLSTTSNYELIDVYVLPQALRR